MSNQKIIVQLIKEISGQSNVLAIPRIFIRMTGDIKAALFLSQCVYWSDKSKRSDGYFYKTAIEWEEETGLTRHELNSARRKAGDFVETKLTKANGVPTLHYRANIEKITAWIEKYYSETLTEPAASGLPESGKPDCRKAENENDGKRQMREPESGKPLTEITQEITQEITPQKEAAGENVFRVYTEEIGVISKTASEELGVAIDDYSEEWVIGAIKQAAISNKRSWSYALGILKRWKAQGYMDGKFRNTPPPAPGPKKNYEPVRLENGEVQYQEVGQ